MGLRAKDERDRTVYIIPISHSTYMTRSINPLYVKYPFLVYLWHVVFVEKILRRLSACFCYIQTLLYIVNVY